MHPLARRLREAALDGAPPVLPRAVDHLGEWWARRPPRQRLALVVAAGSLLVARLVLGAAAAPAEVLVATRDLAGGEVVGPDDLARQRRPVGLAPPGALPADAEVAGRLAGPLPTGAVLTDAHLVAGHPADLAPDGHVALALDAGDLPALATGAVVDLHGGQGAAVLGAVVLGTVDGVTWLGVPREAAGVLVAALAWGPVRVAVLPTTGGAAPGS